jgi:hypothetical protein
MINQGARFQQRYQLVALLPTENCNMQILRSSHRLWDCSPNDALAELELSVWGLKGTLTETCTVIGDGFNISQILFEMGLSHERKWAKFIVYVTLFKTSGGV